MSLRSKVKLIQDFLQTVNADTKNPSCLFLLLFPALMEIVSLIAQSTLYTRQNAFHPQYNRNNSFYNLLNQSIYLDLYQELKPKRNEQKEIINDDI